MAPDQQILSTILLPCIILKQTLPTRTTEPFSKIIIEEHKAEIATWIDKKSNKYNTTNILYDFKLLFCRSRDSFVKNPFWNLCDKKTNFIVVIRVKDTNKILGSYNPLC
ncbi:kelch-like protein 17 [Gigaspora margarita]|uniref:Kelch-like protein 17 n=1 Tax=Gigaspora margarita TaxID=4874 RepID=A0A8H3XCA2_GIGMA|nr:kelch-like protein 17 [Gigaspora margarita]